MNAVADSYGPITSEIIIEDAIERENKQGPSFRDFLRFVAMRRSLSRADEYEKLSDFAASEEQKSFFSDMANLKHREYECLRRYRSDGRPVSPAMKRKPRVAPWPVNVEPKRFAGLEHACRFAMNGELETYCLYLRLADLEEKLETKRQLLFLVRLYKSSLNYVQNRLLLIASLEGNATFDSATSACTHRSFAQFA